jgi:hypothetical protein
MDGKRGKMLFTFFLTNIKTSSLSHLLMRTKRHRRTSFLGISLPPALVQRFDEERGLVPRSKWFRHILETRYNITNENTIVRNKDVAGAPLELETRGRDPASAVFPIQQSRANETSGAEELTRTQEARMPP